MKKVFLLIFTLLNVISYVKAQQDNSSLDLLKAPSSPGFILLNKQPTDIERPSTPTNFMLSLRNASDNFSTLPKNYAVEFAPFWLFCGESMTFDGLIKTEFDPLTSIKQTLTLDFAINTIDTNGLNMTQLGIGLKFSIIRGNHISKEFINTNNNRKELFKKLNDDFSQDENYKKINNKYKSLIITNPTLADVYVAQAQIELNDYNNKRIDSLNKKYNEEFKKLLQTKLKRYGWFWDLTGGLVTEFPQQVFDNAFVPKFGAWTTFGHEGEKDFTFLFVLRELYQQNETYSSTNNTINVANLNHTDAGIRFIYDQDKFSFSLEGLFRATAGANDIKTENKSAWKIMLNANYDLGNNKMITFNFGRDFNGTVTKTGNLVAALNLVMGFGSNRKITN